MEGGEGGVERLRMGRWKKEKMESMRYKNSLKKERNGQQMKDGDLIPLVVYHAIQFHI